MRVENTIRTAVRKGFCLTVHCARVCDVCKLVHRLPGSGHGFHDSILIRLHSVHQWLPVRRHEVHSARLAMRRSSGLFRSQRRDRMRRVQFQFVVFDVGVHHVRQGNQGSFDQEHLLQVFVTLRREEMHVGQSYLRRNHGLPLGSGRAILL